jgi:hypothetical protein
MKKNEKKTFSSCYKPCPLGEGGAFVLGGMLGRVDIELLFVASNVSA